MITKLTVPCLELLKKYGYKVINEDNLRKTIEVSGVIPHYDRQRLYSEGWKTDLEGKNRYIFDMIFCK